MSVTIGPARNVALAGVALLGFLATGCECGETVEAGIEITAPTDGAMLNLASDTNDALSGVQISVEANVFGLAIGDRIDLQVDGVTVTTSVIPSAGPVEWSDVTIPSGAHTLVARAVEGGLASNEVDVTVNDSCFQVTITSPLPAGDRVNLGPDEDTDGVMCGETFETQVVASTAAAPGSMARVFVNGTPRRTTTVNDDGIALFDGVGFDNRGATPNTLRVEVTDPSSVACGADFGVPIFVDCEGVSCAITLPTSGSAYLNADDDTSVAPGFQGIFEVSTDADGAGFPMQLVIDGNETDALSITPAGDSASFTDVSLTEGVHRLRGVCTDDAGNRTASGTSEWTVDTIGCEVAVTSPADDTLFIDTDDLNMSEPGIQVLATGSAAADCTGLRTGPCAAISAAPFESADENWTTTVTLDSMATQTVCAETTDEAGNVNRDMVTVRLRTDAPQLEFATANTAYNVAGTMGSVMGETVPRNADLTSGNATCEAALDVLCTDVGVNVELREMGLASVLATAPCDADASAPAPYMGRAVFASAPLPSRNDGTSYSLQASQAADRLSGTTSVSVLADCVAPQLSVLNPTCGATLQPDTDDSDPITPDFQYDTLIRNNSDPGRPVRLQIMPGTYDRTITVRSPNVLFADAEYGVGGLIGLFASATDVGGNAGVNSACSVTVENIPILTIDAPLDGAVLSTANDCAGGTAGFQLSVTGTTDAADGSDVTVDIGGVSVMTTVSNPSGDDTGTYAVCTDAADGRGVPVTVTIMDPVRGPASAMVTVTIDTLPPTDPITGLVATVSDANRRAGIATLTWNPITDAGGLPVSGFQLRCAAVPIADPASPPASIAWADAQAYTISAAPGDTTASVSGFRPGETRQCVLRASDPAGALTPLSANVAVTVNFLSQTVTPGSLGGTGFGRDVAVVGDVNGDTFVDVLVGGYDSAYLYYGRGDGTLNTTAAVRFRASNSPPATIDFPSFGTSVAAIGDLNGDGISDFAIGDAADCNDTCTFFVNDYDGAVYIVYGRTSNYPMTDCNFDGACTPDIRILSEDGAPGAGDDESAGLGSTVSSAGDFDGDGVMDLAIGAMYYGLFQNGGDQRGRVYIISGASLVGGGTFNVPGDLNDVNGFIVQPSPTQQFFAISVASAGGSVVGDSRHDVLVSSIGLAPSSAARAYVLTGTPLAGAGLLPLPGAAINAFDSESPAERFGGTISGAGDVNGDGRLDALVFYSSEGAQGAPYLYLGSASGFGMRNATTGTPPGSVFQFQNNVGSNRSADRFGTTLGQPRHPFLGSNGDLDRDGRSDTLIGSEQTFLAAGDATLFYGYVAPSNRARPSGVALTGATTVPSGLSPSPSVPNFVGDVNGDGFPDIGIGAPLDAAGSGRFVVVY